MSICPIFVYLICYFLSKINESTGEVHASVILSEHEYQFRELHSSVSKVGKAVDRNFVADFDSTAREEVC